MKEESTQLEDGVRVVRGDVTEECQDMTKEPEDPEEKREIMLEEENEEMKKGEKEAMSGKRTSWTLTREGVLSLYEENLREEITMQVIFKAEIDTIWCLRLSDGRHISPVVYIISKRINDQFSVGAVITIKERMVTPNDPFVHEDKRLWLEDPGLHYIYIKSYKVNAPAGVVGTLMGSVDRTLSYRDEMRYILPALAAWQREDVQLIYELQDSNQYSKSQHTGEALREEGNRHFKNGQYAEALHFYRLVTQQDRFDCRGWSNSSHALFKLENYAAAELHAIFAIKMNPFYDKAYYRAGQSALKDKRLAAGYQYALDGIFVCGESKDLRQILGESRAIRQDVLGAAISSFEGSMARTEVFVSSCFASTIDLVEKVRSSHPKGRVVFKEVQEVLHKKKVADLSNAFGRETRRETKKTHKKPKKPGDEVGAASASASTSREQEKKTKEEENKKHGQEPKKEEKNNNKTKITLNEALQEGRRLFQSEQFQQAIEMYNKCLTYSELTDSINSSVKVKKGERYEVQVIHFIIGMCKVQSSRGYLYEGLETMQTLCGEGSKFPNKPAARFWLAVSYEKICCFKLAQKHAQMCTDSLKNHKSIKPIKWPGTDQPITKTLPHELENECKLLLERPSSARPTPKAKCRYKKCITAQGIPYAKEEIYLIDPDFKGYLNVICEEDCTVSYHPCCWKAYKEQRDGSINRMSDKDVLGQNCVTPDCTGKISSIKIYDDAGELKNEVVKDKKERKNLPAPVKQKKKKDKKKEKNQTHKKRNRVESVCEDQGAGEETSAGGAESTGGQNSTTTTTTTTAASNNNNNNTTSNNNIKQKNQPLPILPIDPESLETAQVTILKPGGESQPSSPPKATKKNKKKKSKKAVNQPNLLADPLEADLCVQNEYVARLRALQQQRDALEADGNINTSRPLSFIDNRQNPLVLLDPNNPFYLPHHLRDNPEELENALQNQLSINSPPGLQRETINTLLDFMYDWLKSEGPMRTSDPRLAEQVAESFPQEARDYVSRCGNITRFLMQSIKFSMIDDIICVRDDVLKAQKMVCKEVSEKMNRSKYLVHYSDGKKAKHFTHLLDDAKSTCSTASSSIADSHISRDSNALNSKFHNYNSSSHNNISSINATSNGSFSVNNCYDIDSGSNASLAPVSKNIVKQLAQFDAPNMFLNPSAPEFEPVVDDHVGKEEEEEDEEDELYEEEDVMKWSSGDSDYIENWAAQAIEEAALMPDDEDEEEEEMEEEDEGEEQGEEYEDEDGEDEEEVAESLQEEENLEEYITQLQNEKDNLAQINEKAQEMIQILNDKVIQVKSQYKSEVMKLKQEIEELKDKNKELSTERHSILSQREADARKYKSDISRSTEELKAFQARLQSAEVKSERCLDQKNEIEAKLAEEEETNSQLREEMDKMKNMQESLTSCSRRAREAEVKYLSIKKDLVEASLTGTIKRLTEEALMMKQVLPGVTDNTVPDRTTLTNTIMVWEETVAGLHEQQRAFNEEGGRLLGMINQGRPLSALPPGDLKIPIIPTLTIAPLLKLFQTNHHHQHNNKHSPAPTPTPTPPPPSQPSTLGVPEVVPGHSRNPSPLPQPPSSPHKSTPPPHLHEPSQVPHMPVPLFQTNHFNGHTVYIANSCPPPPGLPPGPPTSSNPSTGAIPKNPGNPPPSKTPELTNPTQRSEPTNRLFVGQLPWEYTEADVKGLFSYLFGEVVSATVYDKGCNAEGKIVPKYGFVTFRKAEDCLKALNSRPIYVGNHMLNVQERESKKPVKPAGVPTAAGGGGGVGAGVGGGGGGTAGIIGEAEVVNGTNSGRTNFSVSGGVETNQLSAALHHHHTMPTPTLHHLQQQQQQQQQQPPPPTQPVTKPKFQKLPPSNPTVGTISTLPPKLVRPQPKTVPNNSKMGGQAATTKEDNGMSSSSSTYTRLIEVCKQRFGKEFSSPDICTALREVRTQNSNSLMGLTTEKIVERVRQHLRARKAGSGTPSVAPWAGLTQGSGVKAGPEWQGPGNEEAVKEESCSICLEPLNTGPTLPLQCLHTFHEHCIKDWLRRQSNCPNCRKFALMTDEYPTLTQK